MTLQANLAYSAGGVKLVSGNGRITLDNTLDERLRLLEDRASALDPLGVCMLNLPSQMLPEIRKDLFGPNENRKFYT